MPGCDELGERLLMAVKKHLVTNGCDCVLFSGGVDTSFVALAAIEAGLRPQLISVLLPGNVDEEYVDYVSSALGLPLIKLMSSPEELLPCVDEALKAMITIDPIEVISASAVCLGLREALKRGCHCVATGDGGDELFIGYGFLFDRSPAKLRDWLKNVSRGAFFNSIPMSQRVGVRVSLPLYSDEVKRLAAEALEAGCDVAEVGNRRYGKVIMRRVLASRGLERAAWRPKAPITQGSGVEALLKVMASKVSTEEAVRLAKETDIALPSLPHAYLLRRRLELGLPMAKRGKRRSCPICGSALSGDFCRFCGAYLGEGGPSVYSDEVFSATLSVTGRRWPK